LLRSARGNCIVSSMAPRTQSPALRRPTWQKFLLGAGLLAALLGVQQAAAAKKSKKNQGVASVQDPKVDALIDARQDLVRECVIKNGIQKGATVIDLNVQLLLSGEGRVADTSVTATTNGGDKKGLETCVGAALGAIRFPSGLPSMSRVVRTWHFAVK